MTSSSATDNVKKAATTDDDKQWAALEAKAIEQLEQAANNGKSDEPSKGWSFYSELSSGIRVFIHDNPDGTRGVCGVGYIEAAPRRVLQEVSNTKNWFTWDPLLTDVKCTQLSEKKYKTYRLVIKGVWPISARDVVYFEANTAVPATAESKEDPALVLATIGIDFSAYPITDECVRAGLKGGGWHIRPVRDNPNRSLVTYFMNSDPKLRIVPQWLMNWAVTRFPGIIDKVRQGIKSTDKT